MIHKGIKLVGKAALYNVEIISMNWLTKSTMRAEFFI